MNSVERAARALSTAEGIDPDYIGPGMCGDPAWRFKVSTVRQVLEAIREPDEAIRQAMRDNVPVDGHEWEFMEREELSNGVIIDPARDCWHALIDAVLDDRGG